MDVMDRLTDKTDWHFKVFNSAIVSKWRDEALAIPNDYWWGLATSAKEQYWTKDGRVKIMAEETGDLIKVPENIMSVGTFNCVSI